MCVVAASFKGVQSKKEASSETKKNMSSGHKSLATPKKIRGDAELEADQRYIRSLELFFVIQSFLV